MVRVMLIRHAQSMQNEFMETIHHQMSTGQITAEEFNKKMRDAPPQRDAGADSLLTTLGEGQVRRLRGSNDDPQAAFVLTREAQLAPG